MIWQLIRRDPLWRWVPLLTLGVSVFYAAMQHDDPGALMYPAVGAMGVALLALGTQKHDTPFQATLPVTVKQVMLSRLLLTAALLWLPAVAVAVLMAVFHGHVSPIPLAVWSLFSSLLMCSAFTEDKRIILPTSIKIPGWTWFIATAVFSMLCIPLVAVRPGISLVVTIGALACNVSGALLFLATWKVFPASFQESPRISVNEPVSAGEIVQKQAVRGPLMALSIALFDFPETHCLVPFVVAWMTRPNNLFIWAIFSFIHWNAMRRRLPLLLCLPLKPRVLLLAIVMPTLLAISAGHFLSIHFPLQFGHRQHVAAETGLRSVIVTLAVICGTYLLAMLIAQFNESRHFHRLARNVRGAIIVILLGTIGAQRYLPPHEFDPTKWVSNTLPEALWGTIAIGGLGLALLYVALDIVFRQMELLKH